MKNITEFIKEAVVGPYNSAVKKFNQELKKYKVIVEGPDGGGMEYIYANKRQDSPFVCIEVDDDEYWDCYLDDEENGTIWVSLDEEGTADEEIDSSQFDKVKNGYAYTAKNAKLLADALKKI